MFVVFGDDMVDSLNKKDSEIQFSNSDRLETKYTNNNNNNKLPVCGCKAQQHLQTPSAQEQAVVQTSPPPPPPLTAPESQSGEKGCRIKVKSVEHVCSFNSRGTIQSLKISVVKQQTTNQWQLREAAACRHW